MTTVINIRGQRHQNFTRIDRLSIFGNPFKIGRDGTREEVIEKYRRYFYDRIKTDKKFRWAVEALKDCVLGCWCKPLACHGDILVEFIESNV